MNLIGRQRLQKYSISLVAFELFFLGHWSFGDLIRGVFSQPLTYWAGLLLAGVVDTVDYGLVCRLGNGEALGDPFGPLRQNWFMMYFYNDWRLRNVDFGLICTIIFFRFVRWVALQRMVPFLCGIELNCPWKWKTILIGNKCPEILVLLYFLL